LSQLQYFFFSWHSLPAHFLHRMHHNYTYLSICLIIYCIYLLIKSTYLFVYLMLFSFRVDSKLLSSLNITTLSIPYVSVENQDKKLQKNSKPCL
jgi:hypothetical protein